MSYLHVKRAVEALSNKIDNSLSQPNIYDYAPGGDLMDFQSDDSSTSSQLGFSPTNNATDSTPTTTVSSPSSTSTCNFTTEPEERETNKAKKRKIVLNSASGQLWFPDILST
ncbi:hypothetical protein K7432_010649 [Basidiobolus ranarum]|uniref:Uncharacterized protein n=1 Tax=Basidiobolus ranarum TaxID=34480 RepID=A0ABR2WNK0_9FUNG